ncbi:MAG TPA: beta-ketoacyl synthase N-terminal-like domain-containing protein, partial [Alphaproteobacteria bacterium]
MAREVWITGYGLLSPLGETPAAWFEALAAPARWRRAFDAETYAPFPIHPIRDYALERQVPKPGDQRAMGPLMQYGAYAAGLALEMAGLKGNAALLQETHLIAASGAGERDWELDKQILAKLDSVNDRGAFLNRQLSDGLRPTLFLAQLPNLFAGNISLIHGVSGSSRTFMGEEAAGVDALRVALRRCAAGQGDIFLVGAA